MKKFPCTRALDRIARDEGFAGWSLLSARVATGATASEMLSRLSDSDMLLLGARPGHGKTLLGLRLLLDAIRDGRRGVFFTLEYTEQETHACIRSLEGETSNLGATLEIVTSDEIHPSIGSRGTLAYDEF